MDLIRRTCTFNYVDVCPSELFHKTDSTHLAFVLTNFLLVEKKVLKSIKQFKDTRGLDRRSKTMDYLIDQIEINNIVLLSLGYSSDKKLAYENGKNFLLRYNILEKFESDDKKVVVNNIETSVGQLISLTWYSIMLSIFSKSIGNFIRYEKKEQGMIFLDLLPGDNQDNNRSKLEIIKFLTRHPELNLFFEEAVRENKIKRIGYGYGLKNNVTKDLKNDFEFVITDWIAQSLFSLLSKGLAKDTDEEKKNHELSKLANYLIQKDYLKVMNPIKLTF